MTFNARHGGDHHERAADDYDIDENKAKCNGVLWHFFDGERPCALTKNQMKKFIAGGSMPPLQRRKVKVAVQQQQQQQ